MAWREAFPLLRLSGSGLPFYRMEGTLREPGTVATTGTVRLAASRSLIRLPPFGQIYNKGSNPRILLTF